MTPGTQLATLGALLVVGATVDFASRIHVPRDASLRAFSAPQSEPLPAAEEPATARRQLQQWLPGGGGAARMAHGAGAGREPTLQAVFVRGGKAMAVLVVPGGQGRPAETVEAGEGDVVAGWKVAAIWQRSVTLERDDGSRQLVLFSREEPGSADSPLRTE